MTQSSAKVFPESASKGAAKSQRCPSCLAWSTLASCTLASLLTVAALGFAVILLRQAQQGTVPPVSGETAVHLVFAGTLVALTLVIIGCSLGLSALCRSWPQRLMRVVLICLFVATVLAIAMLARSVALLNEEADESAIGPRAKSALVSRPDWWFAESTSSSLLKIFNGSDSNESNSSEMETTTTTTGLFTCTRSSCPNQVECDFVAEPGVRLRHSGKYLSLSSSDSLVLNVDMISNAEKFSMFDNQDDGSVSFIASNGRYLTASSSGSVSADRRNAGSSERFWIHRQTGGFVKIETSRGKFFTVDQSNTVVANNEQNEMWQMDSRNLNPLECCCPRGTLRIIVRGLKDGSAGQTLRIMVFESEDSWKSDSKYRGGRAVAMKSVAIKPEWTQPSQSEAIVFEGLLFYNYAVMAHHDEKRNGKMDTSWYGKPEEGVAATRGASGGPFGGPKWQDAVIQFSRPDHEESLEIWYP